MCLKFRAFDISENFVIALDGPAAAGKSTIGQMLATKFSLKYFQSSIMYRQLAFNCLEKKIDIGDTEAIIALSRFIEIQNNIDLENENIGNIASQIAIISEVRDNINKYLINLVDKTSRIIMEGRDISTVIAPNADLKIFIIADPNIRAQRRYNQLQKKGKACILTELLEQIILRDKRDKEREAGPLLLAKDALVIDTTYLAPVDVLNKITQYILRK